MSARNARKSATTATVETETENATPTATTATATDPAETFATLFANAVSDSSISLDEITNAARAIHGSSRGNRAAQAMATAMGQNLANGNDETVATRILALYNAARVVPTVERATTDAAQVVKNQIAALVLVADQLRGELSESDAARLDSLVIEPDSRDAIANRVTAAAKRGQTRNARTDQGKHGERGEQHVAAWIAANIDRFDDGAFVSVGKIAGKQYAICDVPGSYYYGNENPSVGAIGNVLTTKNNDTAVVGNGWIGQPKQDGARGLVIDKSSYVPATETATDQG